MQHLKVKRTVEILNNLGVGDIFNFKGLDKIYEIKEKSKYAEKIYYTIELLTEETLFVVTLMYGTNCTLYNSKGEFIRFIENDVKTYYWQDTEKDNVRYLE